MQKNGFFRSSQLVSSKITNNQQNAHCNKCKLNLKCKNPKMTPKGRGEIKILHVGDAPDRVEDLKNDQFVGASGAYYRKCLKKLDIEINDGLKTNACVCLPPLGKKPTLTQIKACHPNLRKTINDFQPNVIIALGDHAYESLVSHKFSQGLGKIPTLRGHIIPDREYKAWICPVYHPSFLMNEYTTDVAELIFMNDIRQAIKMIDIPLPYYINENEEDKIEIIKHPKQATKWLLDLQKRVSPFMTAFDYETASIKPQNKKTFIKTCSISLSPDSAVTFPMFNDDKFIDAFKQYLSSDKIKKIAANLKFEQNWSAVKLGTSTQGWLFDTMLASHYLDNRPKINSLEFQNYVNFGIEPYDNYVKKFIKKSDSKGNDINDIDLCDLHDLLLYNGMDAMTEFRLALVQMHRLGIEYDNYYDCITNPKPEQIAPQYFI